MATVIIIKTCQQHQDRKLACEKTWAGYLSNQGIKVWFIEGSDEECVTDNHVKLKTDDSYHGLSTKVKDGFKWLLKQPIPFDYVFLCDDDTIIAPLRFLKFKPDGDLIAMTTKEHPWPNGGGGVFLSKRMVELYTKQLKFPKNGDDSMIWIVARRNGITCQNRCDLFSQWPPAIPDNTNTLVSGHPIDSKRMVDLFPAILELT